MTAVHYFYLFLLSGNAGWQRKINLPQKLSRIVLDLKNEATQGIKCIAKSQTVFAITNTTVFSLSVCSFENCFLNHKKKIIRRQVSNYENVILIPVFRTKISSMWLYCIFHSTQEEIFHNV